MAIFATSQAARADPCAPDRFEDSDDIVCAVDPAAADLRLFWQDSRGVPYRSFANPARSIEDQGKRLVVAINAGMHRTDVTPVDLYVEGGRQLRPADTTTIDRPAREVPNFHKKPNGVFFLGDEAAGILATEKFVKERPDVRFATRSGPRLVVEGSVTSARAMSGV